MTSNQILFVDDDERILKGIQRQQGEDFEITTALGPVEALEIFQDDGPFAVVVSDMRMPEMNGVELLKRIRKQSPDTVRMIITGFAELDTTIQAINDGHIFRFLAKPCGEQEMATSLSAALRQYELIQSERELVEGTLRGSVDVLADILSLINPLAFGQSNRLRTTVEGVLKRVSIDNAWQLEIAAVLASLGCVALPTDLLKKKFSGLPFNQEEESQFRHHPELASRLLRSIPRLDEVSEIIASQMVDDRSREALSPELERKSQILRMALEFDFTELLSPSSLHALDEMRKTATKYDQDLFDALADYVKRERHTAIKEVPINSLREGHVLAEDLCGKSGTLLMSKGQRLTESALRMIENHRRNGALGPKIKVASTSMADAPAAVAVG
ncbi:HD domain-containing phosphohydrolase [Roseiconus lacunae]|uniref:HD domain-containing phosphohydrolase n=1 Tax=Roseiconus lacunae TaxID=2605694 RepID=UPI0011F3C814|nr:HD domain-containing phosphohydrolase [Roseiconus lacunae]